MRQRERTPGILRGRGVRARECGAPSSLQVVLAGRGPEARTNAGLSTVRLLLYIERMEADISLWTGLRAIYARMSSARRRQFFIVVALMLCGAVAELGTI